MEYHEEFLKKKKICKGPNVTFIIVPTDSSSKGIIKLKMSLSNKEIGHKR